MPLINGAQALAGSLDNEGVEVIFGLPGVQVMEFLDAVYQQKTMRWITVRHEQTTAFMAYGYARTTGKVGVALVVPGPGAMNASAAIGTAYAASTPVLLLSGQIESRDLKQNRGVLHEVDDQLEIFRPVTKWCHRIAEAADIPKALQQAMHQLKAGRPRPVELEIPADLLTASIDAALLEPEPVLSVEPDRNKIKDAAKALADASYPVIWAGGGVITSGASDELKSLAEQLNAPVLTTDEGKGAISSEHPLSAGGFYYGNNPVLNKADVILVLGSRFNIPRTSVWKAPSGLKVIQVDIDPAEIGRNPLVQTGINADARSALASLLEELPGTCRSRWQIAELEKIREDFRVKFEEAAPAQLSMIKVIREELGEDGILVPGITNMGYWCHLAYPVFKPRTYLTTSYFLTLGYAFPTALGVKVGNPDKQVVALCGDGGFLYAAPELATAVQEGINLVTLVFVDGAYGACLSIQKRRYQNREMGTRLHNPNFADLAESFGARGIKLSHYDELRDGLRLALTEKRPVVVEVPVPEMVLPWEVSFE